MTRPPEEAESDDGETCGYTIEGCKSFSKAGTNAYVSVVMCLECGHGSKEKKVELPKFTPESCPHDEIDRRGSNRQFIMMYCKQCCTHVDMRDREKTEQFDPVRAKLQLASPDQQRLAARILDEKTLDLEQARASLKIFQNNLEEHFKSNETITSTGMKSYLEDAFDAIQVRSSAHVAFPACMMGAMEDRTGVAMGINGKQEMAILPEVDIMKDPGIWICLDEGCNSNCHGDAWAENAGEKLAKLKSGQKYARMHKRVRSCNGSGETKVSTLGKRNLPCAFQLKNSGHILPTCIQSHEQKGNHPLLLSDPSQAALGLVKNMRKGIVYKEDYDDFLTMYRATGTGLKVVCVSNFPEKPRNPEVYVPEFRDRLKHVVELEQNEADQGSKARRTKEKDDEDMRSWRKVI